jgi:hypothetical protein
LTSQQRKLAGTRLGLKADAQQAGPLQHALGRVGACGTADPNANAASDSGNEAIIVATHTQHVLVEACACS